MFGARRVSSRIASPASAKPAVTSPALTATPSAEAIAQAVIAALTAVGIVGGAQAPALTAKPSAKQPKVKRPIVSAPTAKPSAKPKVIAASAKPKRPAHLVGIARFDDRAAKAAGVDKSTPITADNVRIVAEYIREMYPNAEYTALGGAKSAVRQMLRVQGSLTRDNLLTAWNAVKADFR